LGNVSRLKSIDLTALESRRAKIHHYGKYRCSYL